MHAAASCALRRRSSTFRKNSGAFWSPSRRTPWSGTRAVLHRRIARLDLCWKRVWLHTLPSKQCPKGRELTSSLSSGSSNPPPPPLPPLMTDAKLTRNCACGSRSVTRALTRTVYMVGSWIQTRIKHNKDVKCIYCMNYKFLSMTITFNGGNSMHGQVSRDLARL